MLFIEIQRAIFGVIEKLKCSIRKKQNTFGFEICDADKKKINEKRGKNTFQNRSSSNLIDHFLSQEQTKGEVKKKIEILNYCRKLLTPLANESRPRLTTTAKSII